MSCCFPFPETERKKKIQGLKQKHVWVSLQQNKNTHPHRARRSLKEFRSESSRNVHPALSSALSQYGYLRRPKAPSQSKKKMGESVKMVDYYQADPSYFSADASSRLANVLKYSASLLIITLVCWVFFFRTASQTHDIVHMFFFFIPEILGRLLKRLRP